MRTALSGLEFMKYNYYPLFLEVAVNEEQKYDDLDFVCSRSQRPKLHCFWTGTRRSDSSTGEACGRTSFVAFKFHPSLGTAKAAIM